jgi:hypothetical protein
MPKIDETNGTTNTANGGVKIKSVAPIKPNKSSSKRHKTPFRIHNRKTSVTINRSGDRKQSPSPLAGAIVTTGADRPNNIRPEIAYLAVDINSVTYDPKNARLHPEDNLESIKQCLYLHGQYQPIIARKDTNHVVIGNGRLEAALSLGWTQIAVQFMEMTEIEAISIGLADNRTAELAKWDQKTLADLGKLLGDAAHPSIGWTLEELSAMRAADWVPPEIEDEDTDSVEGDNNGDITLSAQEEDTVSRAVQLLRDMEDNQTLSRSQAVAIICKDWLEERLNGH